MGFSQFRMILIIREEKFRGFNNKLKGRGLKQKRLRLEKKERLQLGRKKKNAEGNEYMRKNK